MLNTLILHNFLSSAVFFFQNQLFRKIISGIPSECQTVWTQIRPDVLSGSDLGPNCLQKLADNSKPSSAKIQKLRYSLHAQLILHYLIVLF